MSREIKINENYSIVKEDILNKYQNMDQFFQKCIKSLYGEENENEINCFLPCNIINDEGNNYLSSLKPLENKTGIYIFLDSESIPVYIGKGGTSQKSAKGKDLKFRVGQELGSGNTHNTLSNNIIKIKELLENKNINKSDSINDIKSFSLLTISIGDRVKDGSVDISNIDKSNALEMILIALFRPKYNR